MSLQRQFLIWVCVGAVLAYGLVVLRDVLAPFIAGLALGYLLDPLTNRLERLGLRRFPATLLMLGAGVLVIALALVLLVPVLIHQSSAFVQMLPGLAQKTQALVTDKGSSFLTEHGGLLERFGFDPSVFSSQDLQKSVSDLAGQGTQYLAAFARSLWSGGSALLSLGSFLIVTPVVAFYLLLDWKRMIAAIDSWVPIQHRATVRELAREIDAALAGFLRGQSLVCLFLGLWYGIGLSLVGLNFGFLIGITGGLLSFIPYIGSLITLFVAVAVALVQGWPNWSLLLFTVGVVGSGQFIEGNILSPNLVGHSVGLHPVWLMFALLAFGSLFGFPGLLVAVPVSAAFGVLLRFGLRQYLGSPLYTGRDDKTSVLVAPVSDRSLRG